MSGTKKTKTCFGLGFLLVLCSTNKTKKRLYFNKSPFLNLFIKYPEIYSNYLKSCDTLKVNVQKIYDIRMIMVYVETQEIKVIYVKS